MIKKNALRRLKNNVMLFFSFLSIIIALIPLISLLYYITAQGISAINIDFFIRLPKPVGEPGGGMANAIVGTVILVGLASLIGIPIGLFSGIYLAEFGNNRLGYGIRFIADVLSGIPSIITGIFAYTLIVLSMGRFSAFAAAIALSIIMIPTITRTTEELIKLVPSSLREASLSLGVPAYRTIIKVVLRTARGGILTGVILTVARIAGETAPLLFTSLNNLHWSLRLDQPMASLPVMIYTYAISPFDDWRAQAWAGAFVLLVFVLSINIISRFILKDKLKRG